MLNKKERRKIGLFFSQGHYNENYISNLESRIVNITPEIEIEKDYSEEIEIYKQVLEENPYIRVELIWENDI